MVGKELAPTPRTDAADMISDRYGSYVDIEFCRDLERELAEFKQRTIDELSTPPMLQIMELRKQLSEAYKWILNRGLDIPDHACVKCIPHSDVLIKGFVCAYHKASAFMEEMK